jgi:hypothetical protein
MTLLTAETLDFGYRDAGYPDLGEGLTNIIQLERLDDCRNHLHASYSSFRPVHLAVYRPRF